MGATGTRYFQKLTLMLSYFDELQAPAVDSNSIKVLDWPKKVWVDSTSVKFRLNWHTDGLEETAGDVVTLRITFKTGPKIHATATFRNLPPSDTQGLITPRSRCVYASLSVLPERA